ncbi:MAG: hypothetical protein JO328_11455 [Hyphomicrobiales bacterium]|nr:hypothetical protein [Hyphomicrobiales bacterium]MBV8824601.1 hypothetical protein [Hyphomicrobiales bacterium]
MTDVPGYQHDVFISYPQPSTSRMRIFSMARRREGDLFVHCRPVVRQGNLRTRDRRGFRRAARVALRAPRHVHDRQIAKLLSLEPTFTVEHFGKTYPFKRDDDRQRYMEGLRLAGVPER